MKSISTQPAIANYHTGGWGVGRKLREPLQNGLYSLGYRCRGAGVQVRLTGPAGLRGAGEHGLDYRIGGSVGSGWTGAREGCGGVGLSLRVTLKKLGPRC